KKDAGRVRADLRLVEVGAGGTLGTRRVSAEAAEGEGVFGLAGRVGAELGHALGATKVTLATAEKAGATSVEAAKAYQEGRARLLVGDFVKAAPALERAVAADPAYAEAFERLAETYQSLGRQEKALAAAKRAAEIVGAAETRVAYRVRARTALLQGDTAEA